MLTIGAIRAIVIHAIVLASCAHVGRLPLEAVQISRIALMLHIHDDLVIDHVVPFLNQIHRLAASVAKQIAVILMASKFNFTLEGGGLRYFLT